MTWSIIISGLHLSLTKRHIINIFSKVLTDNNILGKFQIKKWQETPTFGGAFVYSTSDQVSLVRPTPPPTSPMPCLPTPSTKPRFFLLVARMSSVTRVVRLRTFIQPPELGLRTSFTFTLFWTFFSRWICYVFVLAIVRYLRFTLIADASTVKFTYSPRCVVPIFVQHPLNSSTTASLMHIASNRLLYRTRTFCVAISSTDFTQKCLSHSQIACTQLVLVMNYTIGYTVFTYPEQKKTVVNPNCTIVQGQSWPHRFWPPITEKLIKNFFLLLFLQNRIVNLFLLHTQCQQITFWLPF
jgi:hypothetical protein